MSQVTVDGPDSRNYANHAMDVLADRIAREGLSRPGDTLLRLYALLVLTIGPATTKIHVHDARALYFSLAEPDHPSLVPFSDLSQAVRDLEESYAQAIRKSALELAAVKPLWPGTGQSYTISAGICHGRVSLRDT